MGSKVPDQTAGVLHVRERAGGVKLGMHMDVQLRL